MPCISVSTNVELSVEKCHELREKVANAVEQIPGKRAAGTMVKVEAGCVMAMGDPELPCAWVFVDMIGAAAVEEKTNFCAATAQALMEVADIPSNRIYQTFHELPDWGLGAVCVTK